MYDLSLFFILLVFKSLVNQNLSAATPRNYSCSHFSVENYFFGDIGVAGMRNAGLL
jgi:hypothetical protein